MLTPLEKAAKAIPLLSSSDSAPCRDEEGNSPCYQGYGYDQLHEKPSSSEEHRCDRGAGHEEDSKHNQDDDKEDLQRSNHTR